MTKKLRELFVGVVGADSSDLEKAEDEMVSESYDTPSMTEYLQENQTADEL